MLDQFRDIKCGLDTHINDIPWFIPEPAWVTTLASLKPLEDMFNGLICAWKCALFDDFLGFIGRVLGKVLKAIQL